MSKQTILTIAQQQQWLTSHSIHIIHKWSCRGMGNSRIMQNGYQIGHAGGCGYDRYGAALGEAIMTLFGAEIHKLAKRVCTGRDRKRKKAKGFYGLHYSSITGKAYVDGASGSDCMEKILHKIGFSLNRVGETGGKGQTGEVFYTLAPVTATQRLWI